MNDMSIYDLEEVDYDENDIPFCPECKRCLSVSKRGNLYCGHCAIVFLDVEPDDWEQDDSHPGHPNNYGDRPN